MNLAKLAQDNKIYEVVAGSHSYGLNTPESDLDIRGVFMEPKECVYGLNVVEQSQDEKQDIVIYGLKKFVKLAADCNPNIIELLFTGEKNIRFINHWGKVLRDFRHVFLSERAKHSFTGYAFAQLKKIKGHNHWNNNPQPVTSPFVEDFIVKKKVSDIKVSDDEEMEFLTQKADREIEYLDLDAYRQKFRQWKQYWRWKENRNPARAKLEAEYGFDGKHGMHLIRLLLMGKEILATGEITVERPEKDLLLGIRQGKYTFDEVVQMSEQLMSEIEQTKIVLPHSPDIKVINELLITLYEDYYGSSHQGTVSSDA